MAFDEVRERLFSAISKSKNPKEFSNVQGADEQELIGYVKGQIEECRSFAARISSEGIWLTNIAYLLGFDSIFYDTSVGVYRPINVPGQFFRRNRISVNGLLSRAQNRAARLTKSPPKYDVRPKSMSEEDKDAARLGLYIINQVWDQQVVNKKRLELAMWMQQCGHAYLKTCWDHTLGPKVPFEDPITGQVKYESLGDIRVDVINAFEMFPDPLAKSFEELGKLTQARVRPIHYFRDQYGEKGDLVKPEDVWLTSLQYEYRINSFNNQAGAATGVSPMLKHCAIEISYYEKPSYKHPNGRYIVTANGVMLKNEDLPIDELPFAKFDDVLVAGKYYSESVITHARPIQDQLNRVISMRAEWANRMLTGKYLAARGHGLFAEALNDQSGEVVEYDPVPNAAAPQAMSTPSIPQYAYTEDEYLTKYLDDIFGINEISRGQLPSASIPAVGMQYLQEQDETRIGVVTEQNEYGYAATGRQILKFAERYYTTPRILKISGKGMEYTVKNFIGADINGNNDVMVIRGSTLPGSKVLRRQEILNLHERGMLGDPNDPKVKENVLNSLEFGDVQEVWKDHTLDMAQIKKQIKMIEEGIKPPVSEYDNHPLFMQELNRYRKSDKFDLLPPEAQAILIETMEAHTQELLELMQPTDQDDPNMQESTAAQEEEAQIKMDMGIAPDENVDPEAMMDAAANDQGIEGGVS